MVDATEDTTFALPDIPDLSGLGSDRAESEPFADGWYKGTIVEKRELTDRAGNERIFESGDNPSANGESRNITLQVQLVRKADGRKMGTNYRVNYRADDLSPETVRQIAAKIEEVKGGGEWGPQFRQFKVLQRLSAMQKVAGVRKLARNGNGGLDIHPLFGKDAWFKLQPDRRNPQYKEIADMRDTEPKRNAL